MKNKKLYSYILTFLLVICLFPRQIKSSSSSGSISGTVTGSIVAGVTIDIKGISPTAGSWTGVTNVYGHYDTSEDKNFLVVEPGKYLVTASYPNSSYIFSNPVIVDLSESKSNRNFDFINFTSTPTDQQFGRIIGNITGSCLDGVTILISGIERTTGSWEFKTDTKGFYQTSLPENCILPCPGKYLVTASKPGTNCAFSPTAVIVEISTCCDTGGFGVANFNSRGNGGSDGEEKYGISYRTWK